MDVTAQCRSQCVVAARVASPRRWQCDPSKRPPKDSLLFHPDQYLAIFGGVRVGGVRVDGVRVDGVRVDGVRVDENDRSE